jgi:hypothetical protein
VSTCARVTCPRKGKPGHNRGYCHVHYDALPVKGYVDSLAARERIALLRSRGMTLRMLTEHGVSRFGVRGIELRPRIRALTEAKVMAIPLPSPLPTGAPVDATGTRRRIQGLVAMGWRQAQIAEQIGTTQTGVSALTRQRFVTSETAILVRDLFKRWAMTPGPSQLSRDRARAAGWMVPLAWDDIDDPAETPTVGKHTTTTASERIEELYELGVHDVYQIAERLRIQPGSVERQLIRDRGAA